MIDEFVELLAGEQIKLVADIRRFPASRAHPQFNAEPLAAALKEQKIDYQQFGGLGGRRNTRLPNSPNTAWRVDSFNRYADYMTTDDFASAFDQLIDAATQRRTAIMCSEAVPWRCHRRLVADALIVRGWEVCDIIGRGPTKPHAMTPFAKVAHGTLTYPSEASPGN